jgi:alpha-ketoglutarate-dependent taurine dioxygenase
MDWEYSSREQDMALKLTNLEPRIGVRVEASKSDLLNGSHTAELRQLLETRAVVVFPKVDFTDSEHLAFSRTLGTVIPVGEEGVRPISRVGIDAAYITASFHWHFDGAFDDVPALAGLLTARELSANGGGQTQFANTYAAYADLPEDEKEAYDKLRVVHSFEANQRINDPVPSYKTLLAWRQRYPYPKLQPLVWHHRNGLNSLAVGTTASHLDGMGLDDGRLLLAKLLDWCTQPQYVYAHDWEVGDLVVYDNTAVLHRVTPYAADSGRLMKRTALFGEEPLI